MRRTIVHGQTLYESPFKSKLVSVSAKVDFITIPLPLPERPDKHNLVREIGKIAKKKNRVFQHKATNGIELTIHDPTAKELSALMVADPSCQITALEIAVDFKPRKSSSVTPTNDMTYRYLRHVVMPSKLPALAQAVRKVIFQPMTPPKIDRLGDPGGWGTLYWEERSHYLKVRMYLKEFDQGIAVDSPFVRIELSLSRGGCQDANVDSLAGLPVFFKTIRKRYGDAFYVARGVKYSPLQSKSKKGLSAALIASEAERSQRLAYGFDKYGAMWCSGRGHLTAPDTPVNKLIADALDKLSVRYSKFKVAPKKERQIERTAAKFQLLYQ